MIRKKSAKFIVFVSALVLMLSGSAYAGTVNAPPLFVTDIQFMDCMATNIAQVPKDITLVIYNSLGAAVVGPQDFTGVPPHASRSIFTGGTGGLFTCEATINGGKSRIRASACASSDAYCDGGAVEAK